MVIKLQFYLIRLFLFHFTVIHKYQYCQDQEPVPNAALAGAAISCLDRYGKWELDNGIGDMYIWTYNTFPTKKVILTNLILIKYLLTFK
jgi:hypothetical protein